MSEFDVKVPSGRLHAKRWGDERDPLVLCVPGLTANIRALDFLGERLARPGLQLVAVDLRGRGLSETTPPGTYGWDKHAQDVFAVADALGFTRFSVIGQSLGAAIAMNAAAIDAGRLQKLVLIDVAGMPDPRTGPPIMASAARLGGVHPSVEAFIETVRSVGTVEPWSPYWETYYRYELEPAGEGDGVRSRTNREAVIEDAMYTGTHDPRSLWPALTMPVLLLRAARELLPGAGHLVTEEDRDRFRAEVPLAEVVEIDANHYGISLHEDSAAAIRGFLSGPQDGAG